MYKWTKKLHIYAGLVSFMAFIVWGVAGIVATIQPAPGARTPPQPKIRYVDFQVPPELDDQQVADRMFAAVQPPFVAAARPQRDPEGRLFLNYFTPNARRRYVLLEDQNRIQVEESYSSFPAFVNIMHVQTWNHSNPGFAVKLWAAYNEFSLWAMLFMSVSGLYMWIATRPRMRWAQWTLAAATGFFCVVYFSLR